MDEIIKGCLNNDTLSQSMLYDIYYKKAYLICYKYLKSKEVSEDVVQIGFIKLFDRIDSYNTEYSFDGWLSKIFKNCSLDYLRVNRIKYVEELFDIEEEVIEKDDIIPSESVMKAIESLPATQREVFKLHAIQGYKHREIAEMLNIKVNTSRSNYSRAKEKLVVILSKYL